MNVKATLGTAIAIFRKRGIRALLGAIVSHIKRRGRDLSMLNSYQPVPPFKVEDFLDNEDSGTVPGGEAGLHMRRGGAKILYVIHQFFPEHYLGTEKFLLNLASCMQKSGHNVKVMTSSSYKDSQYEQTPGDFLHKEYLYRGILVLAYKQRHPPLYGEWNIENPELEQFAERVLGLERPDLLHVTHGMCVGSAALAAQRLRIPYVITLTDFFFLCPNCKLITSKGALCAGPEQGARCQMDCPEYDNEIVRKRLLLSEKILRGASDVIAPSRFLGNLFKREFRWLEPKVIPYGMDLSAIKRTTKVYNGTEKLVVLFAGQLDIHKGVHVLIDAVKSMESKNILVKIYGSGPLRIEQRLKQRAAGDDRIRFCGVYAEDQLGDVFGTADCVVIPSLWHENNTIVMREALASHLPCIVSDAGGMVEMIREGRNGFVFRMGDRDHLREVLERLVNTPELLASMKKDVNSYAVTTIEQEASAYERVYAAALG